MSDNQLYDVWWNDDVQGEQSMEINHNQHWKKVINVIEEKDFSCCKILDFGCNQGGFLRFLYEKRPFLKGVGIDLATKSIDVANNRKGNLPIDYEATANVEKFNHSFDIAFSISVIYLLKDLTEHANKIKKALKPGGVACCILKKLWIGREPFPCSFIHLMILRKLSLTKVLMWKLEDFFLMDI